MGYEVMDAGDDATSAADQLRLTGSVDVQGLGELKPQPQRDPLLPGGRSRRATSLVALTVLAVVGAGAYWAQHGQPDQRLTARSQPRVLAVAQPATLTMAGSATAASVRISVVNVGPVPVQVVTSPAHAAAARGATQVGLANGGLARIAPGAAQQVVAVVGISCVSSTWITPQLSIRGPDGVQHPVTVRDANLDSYQVNTQAICGTPGGSNLTAKLAGTVADPLLLLHNSSDRDVAVTVDPHSPVPQAPDLSGQAKGASTAEVVVPPVELRTTPKLPVVLRASSDLTVALQLHLRGCLPLSALTMQPYLQLLGVPVAVQPDTPDGSGATIDLTSLLGSELARVCS
ncbi:hypothetical protein ACPPVT_14150 [Angustibacter sp. McL0619]|uniref:hypothetical protein n=1 Tax=Angustibacter sp. McL0619 TaxID=3415676 RepID=UPI003CF66C6F